MQNSNITLFRQTRAQTARRLRAQPLRQLAILVGTALTTAFLASAATAQGANSSQSRNVAHINVTEAVSVKQDWLRLTLGTAVRGSGAKDVQNRLNQAVRKTLELANQKAADGKMEVSSGSMNMYFDPQYSSGKRVFSSSDSTKGVWQGSAEVILQGSDFSRILATADAAQHMTVQNLQFGLSPQTRKKAGEQAQELAITAFGKEAQKVSRAFGFQKYSIREVHVQANRGSVPVQMEMVGYAADAARSTVPAQAGQQQVQATVRGSIQMR